MDAFTIAINCSIIVFTDTAAVVAFDIPVDSAMFGDTRGLTYYKHGETPGLGGEVDNRRWKALWTGRSAYDEGWQPVIEVIKGRAGTPDESPYEVDGLSGATITSRAAGGSMPGVRLRRGRGCTTQIAKPSASCRESGSNSV